MHETDPPLNALKAFEASARHLSLTKAAAELHVTPAALSHQVRGLEELLGVKLFVRLPRALALTEAGQKLLPGLTAGFGEIRRAVARVRAERSDGLIVVSTPPGFTAKWLAPRLHRFLAFNEHIEVRISSTMKMADFDVDGVDVAIRQLSIASADDPRHYSLLLAALELAPVCSPKFLARHPLRRPADLAGVPIVHDASIPRRTDNLGWPDWLAAAGAPGLTVGAGITFNSADHAMEAAVEGAGVLLAHTLLAGDDVREGRLVLPFRHRLAMQRGYHFVCPLGHETRPANAAFQAWLQAEFARCCDSPASNERRRRAR